jgi:hypothetical protein
MIVAEPTVSGGLRTELGLYARSQIIQGIGVGFCGSSPAFLNISAAQTWDICLTAETAEDMRNAEESRLQR